MDESLKRHKYMITFWNRKEIYVGTVLKSFSEIKDFMRQNGIQTTYKIVSHSNQLRGRGINLDSRTMAGNMYYLYVHKSQYEVACMLKGQMNERY